MEGILAMRNRVLTTALVFAIVAALAAGAFAQVKTTKGSGKDPIAVIGEKTINLGEVLEGQDYEHSFVIKNGGTAELQILSVRPG